MRWKRLTSLLPVLTALAAVLILTTMVKISVCKTKYTSIHLRVEPLIGYLAALRERCGRLPEKCSGSNIGHAMADTGEETWIEAAGRWTMALAQGARNRRHFTHA